MPKSEELREALYNLEKARKREAEQRQIAEALLEGLNAVLLVSNSQDLFLKLIEIMRRPLDFEEAFILIMGKDGKLKPAASSAQVFTDVDWEVYDMFGRVIKGTPVAVFNTRLVPEWNSHSETLFKKAKSALHFSFNTKERKAIFTCTHSCGSHFSKYHISLAQRFSVLASQALQKIESAAKIETLEERLEAEEKIAALNKKLAESEQKLSRARKMEAIGLLAGGVAHDLNNILSSIICYPELLLLQPDLSSENRSAIQAIREAGQRSAAIVSDLLTVTRGVASPKESINLNDIIKKYFLSPEYREIVDSQSGLLIQSQMDPNLLNIKASPVHIMKSLMNLISNAVEAAQNYQGGIVTITTENRYVDKPLRHYEEVTVGEYAVLTVSDNGPGISSDDIERIFEPFYTKKTMGRSGTGLGLTIVWNTIKDHNGYIDINTEDGGVSFELYFPVTREPAQIRQKDIPIDEYRGNGQFVLVVDDRDDQRKITCAMLKHLGYKADAVSGGEEAIQYIREKPVDIFILDMIMDPGISGRKTYEEIIKINPGQKAIIASGYSKTEDVVMTQKLGAGQYIKKPFTLEILGIALRNELSKCSDSGLGNKKV